METARRRTRTAAGLDLITLASTIGQNRFGYYLAIELALLAAWLCARVLRWSGATVVAPRARLVADAAVVLVAAVVFYPSIPPALKTARWDFGVPPPWREALVWMRDATPEPFQNPEQYYARDPAAPIAPAYTVMNWWDYGYWLMRIAHRVPVANPTQSGAVDAARFFTETDPEEAERLLRVAHARYVVTGEELPMRTVASPDPWQRWFEAMPLWARREPSRYFELFYERSAAGTLVRTVVFNPDYYRTMMSRLYLFGGTAVEPRNATWIITWDERAGPGGQLIREITSSQRFESYEAARARLARMGPGRHRLVGRDPRMTCVPLPGLDRETIAYQSPERSRAFPGLPAVRIFEVRGDHPPAS